MRIIITLLICLLIGSMNGGDLMAQSNIRVPVPVYINVQNKKKPARKNNKKKRQRYNWPQSQSYNSHSDSEWADSDAVEIADTAVVEEDVMDGYVENRPVQGNIYTGYISDYFPNGEGHMVYNETDGEKSVCRTYDGNFRYGLRSGKGTCVYRNGDTYTGDWDMDKPHGFGIYTWATNKYYFDGKMNEGQFYDGFYYSADKTPIGIFKKGVYKRLDPGISKLLKGE